jgi:hypothetical protein
MDRPVKIRAHSVADPDRLERFRGQGRLTDSGENSGPQDLPSTPDKKKARLPAGKPGFHDHFSC